MLSEETVMQVLEWCYDKAINGTFGLDSAQELAKSYLDNDDSPHEQANSLIRWQNTKAASSGFITGIGGLITLPVAIPANITSVLFVQIRMIVAIAYIGKYDPRNDKVKTLVYACLTASTAKEAFKSIGINVGNKVAINAIN